MRYCIVTMFDHAYAPLWTSLRAHRDAVCATCGVVCVYAPPPATASRPMSWYKLHAVAHALRGGCDAALWLDADASMNVPFVLPATAPLVAVRDVNGLNMGAFVATREALPLLRRVWHTTTSHHPWWEQAALRMHLQTNRSDRSLVRLVDGLVDYGAGWRERPLSHPAGCFSTRPRRVCMAQVAARLAATNTTRACVSPLRLPSSPVDERDLWL
jgi:hypothetical protein